MFINQKKTTDQFYATDHHPTKEQSAASNFVESILSGSISEILTQPIPIVTSRIDDSSPSDASPLNQSREDTRVIVSQFCAFLGMLREARGQLGHDRFLNLSRLLRQIRDQMSTTSSRVLFHVRRLCLAVCSRCPCAPAGATSRYCCFCCAVVASATVNMGSSEILLLF